MRSLVIGPIREVLSKPPAFQPPPVGADGINLTIGDPTKVDKRAFKTPQHIVDAATRQFDGEYAPPHGYPRLLDLLKTREKTEHILVTNGGSEAVEKLFQVIDGEIILPDPCFTQYIDHQRHRGINPQFYRATPETGIDLEELERRITDRTIGILVINPSNPTGAVYSDNHLMGVVDIAKRKGLIIIADEAYHSTVFVTPPTKMRDLTKEVPIVELVSLSKEYLMCGYRCGCFAFHNVTPELEELERALFRLCATRLCANGPGQLAAIAALEGGREHVEPMVAELRRRAGIMVEGLSSVPGIRVMRPGGAFFVWAGVEGTRFEKDLDFVGALGEQAKVFVLPGRVFGEEARYSADPTLWFRAVFLPPVEKIIEGCNTIKQFVEKNRAHNKS